MNSGPATLSLSVSGQRSLFLLRQEAKRTLPKQGLQCLAGGFAASFSGQASVRAYESLINDRGRVSPVHVQDGRGYGL